MLNHIVLFRRKPDVAPRPDFERDLVARMNALAAEIGSIRGWRFFEWAAVDYTDGTK